MFQKHDTVRKKFNPKTDKYRSIVKTDKIL